MAGGEAEIRNERDTIVGVGTPPGEAGIAVVRLSGEEALAIGARLVPALARSAPTRRLRLCRVVHPEGGELIDVAMVCHMAGPRSYTGEDVVELQTHGGPATVAAVVRASTRAGARMAGPGEFTQRAFLNGRLDLTEAEAVAALIGARSDRARRVALRQLSGSLGEAVRALHGSLVASLAEVEARLDFPEEELAAFSVDDVVASLAGVRDRIEALLAQAPSGRLAREGARVVLVGRPNVGKSSLLNALLGRERAIVHEQPGTTRDYLEDELSAGGVALTIVDTAGQRADGEPAEALGVTRGLEQARAADLALLVVNLAEGLTAEDRRLLGELVATDCLLVLNQRDRVSEAELKQVADRRSDVVAVTVASTGEGVETLRNALLRRFGGEEGAFEELPLVSEQRHEDALRAARSCLDETLRLLAEGAAEDLVALELRQAAVALGSIVGLGVTEDVLEAIFSRFCIGK